MKNAFKKDLKDRERGQADIFELREKHYGIFNRDKTIYYINETDCNLGFFAMYRYWIEYLYFTHMCGYTPVIHVGSEFAYSENKALLGTRNPFEYYFQQPAAVKVKEAMHSNKVIFSNVVHRQMVELILTGKRSHYDCNVRYLRLMGEIVQKYLKFNQVTQAYIDDGLKRLEIENKKTLGVHIRGTDFKKKYDNHPVFVTEAEMFQPIEELFEKKQYQQIFVATDEQQILESFKKRYGDKMLYYSDVMRSNDRKSVAFHASSRVNHKYKLGLEVIRDMYTLSKCDGFVAGISQVAVCARINKLSRKEKYQDLIIIDKGIQKSGRLFYRHN